MVDEDKLSFSREETEGEFDDINPEKVLKDLKETTITPFNIDETSITVKRAQTFIHSQNERNLKEYTDLSKELKEELDKKDVQDDIKNIQGFMPVKVYNLEKELRSILRHILELTNFGYRILSLTTKKCFLAIKGSQDVVKANELVKKVEGVFSKMQELQDKHNEKILEMNTKSNEKYFDLIMKQTASNYNMIEAFMKTMVKSFQEAVNVDVEFVASKREKHQKVDVDEDVYDDGLDDKDVEEVSTLPPLPEIKKGGGEQLIVDEESLPDIPGVLKDDK